MSDRRRFGRAVGALDPRAERRVGLVDERRAHARAAARDQPQRLDACRVEARRVHEPDEERRRTDHERDAARVSMRSSAASGSQRGHEDAAERHDAGQRDPVQQPADVRARRGHEDAVVRAEAVRAAHDRGLVRERRLRVQHALRRAARSRRAQHDGECSGSGQRLGRPVGPAGSASRSSTRVGCDARSSMRRRPRRCRPGGGSVRRRRRGASTPR